MECVVCFQFLSWIIIYRIRQYWNCILYFHIQAFLALTIDSTNWTQYFFVSFSFICLRSILTQSTPLHCDAALFFSIVTRIVNIVCVNCLIKLKTSYKVSVTIAGDCDSIATLEVMIAPWNVLCVFQFLYWTDIYWILQYWNCILYSDIRPFQALSIDSTN